MAPSYSTLQPWITVALRKARSPLLLGNPRLAISAILTIGAGIGFTSVFASLAATLFRGALPYPAPHELFVLSAEKNGQPAFINYGALLALTETPYARASVAGAMPRAYVLEWPDGAATALNGSEVSGHLFAVLGVHPHLGRTIEARDDVPGAPPVAVLAYRLWRERFGSDTAAVGMSVQLDGVPHQIIGVMPEWLDFPERSSSDLWTPAAVTHVTSAAGTDCCVIVIARSGVPGDIQRLSEGLRALLQDRLPAHVRRMAAHSTSLRTYYVNEMGLAELGIAGAILCLGVLILTFANVAALLVSRSIARTRDIAIRVALGAPPSRILGPVAVDALLISMAGAALALVSAWLSVAYLQSRLGPDVPSWFRVSPDWRLLLFSLVGALLIGMLSAIIPAWLSLQIRPNDALKTGASGSAGEDGRIQKARRLLIALEVAFAMCAVVTAATCAFHLLQERKDLSSYKDPGLIAVMLTPRHRDNLSSPGRQDLPRRFLEAARTLDGFDPLAGEQSGIVSTDWITSIGSVSNAPPSRIIVAAIQGQYSMTFGLNAVRGRLLSSEDSRREAPLAVLTQGAAMQLFGTPAVVGTSIRIDSLGLTTPVEIVGIVEDGRHMASLTWKNAPVIYTSAPITANWTTVLIGRPLSLDAASLRTLAAGLQSTFPEYPSPRVRSLAAMADNALAFARLPFWVLVPVAGLALLVAATGLFGVTSFFVHRRQRELAIRSALGSSSRKLRLLLYRDTIPMVLGGIVMGSVAAFIALVELHGLMPWLTIVNFPAIVLSVFLIGVVVAGSAAGPLGRLKRIAPAALLHEE